VCYRVLKILPQDCISGQIHHTSSHSILSTLIFLLSHLWLDLYSLLTTVTGWYRTKRSCNCDQFLIYSASHLSSNNSLFVHQSSLLWLQQRHVVAKRRETGREMAFKFWLSVSLAYLKGYLKRRKILRHWADRFTSPLKEVVVCICSSIKIHRSRMGLNPRTMGPIVSTTDPRSAAAWWLGSRVRIPLGEWMFVCCIYIVTCVRFPWLWR
jgi:hypothetical protein